MKSKSALHHATSAGTVWLAVCLLTGCVTLSGGGATTNDIWAAQSAPSPKARAYAHYLASVVYTRDNDQDKALNEMQEVAKLDPDAMTPTLRLVRSYLRSQDYEKALAMAEKAVQQQPDQVNLWVVLGEIYRQLQRFPDATECFAKAIELKPDNMLGYGAMVELLEGINDVCAAVDLYDKLIQLSPNAAGLYYQKAIALARMNANDEARKYLEKSVELNPRLIQAYFMLGSVCFETKDYPAAIRYLSFYGNVRPKNTRTWELLAAAHFRQEQFNEAIGAYLKISEHGEATPAQRIQGMYLMIVTGNSELLEKIGEVKDAPIFSAVFAILAGKTAGNDYKAALDGLDGIAGDLEQECTDFLPGIHYLYGDQAASGWLFDRLGELRGDTPSWTLGVIQARILSVQEKWEDALALYATLLDNSPRDKWLHYNMAICCEEAKRFEEAEAHLKKYIEYDPANPDVLNFLGYLYAELNMKIGDAENLIRAALATNPESPYYLDSLGWVYYRQGKADLAIENIQRALYLMDNDDAILREHLGDAYLLKGDTEKALAQWQRAVRLDPKIEGVAEKIEAHAAKKAE